MTNARQPAEKMDLNHLHLHVRNLGRAKRFYESYFRFRERVRHQDILFLRNTSGFDLALAPDRTPFSFPEWFHFGFRLGSARAVRKLHSRMSSEGVKLHDIEEHAGYVTFRCMDSDGYGIEVYWE
jgi:catechol-2,3-dioxygenase